MTGMLHKVLDFEQFSARFAKQEFLVETQGRNVQQQVLFTLANDKIRMLQGLVVGEEISVDFNIRCRAWTSPRGDVKHFVTLDVWRVEGIGDRLSRERADGAAAVTPTPMAPSEEDDIPF